MSRRPDKCQQRQGIQAPEGTDALTVGVNVTVTGPSSTESRPGGGMEVKVKVLQGRTPDSDAITRGLTATATSSHHRPVTAPAAISDEKRLEVENNEAEGVEFTFTRGSSHFQDADNPTNKSDDVMEIEVLPISRANVERVPIFHRTVATVSSGKHRDVVYIDGKIEARSSHEQTIIKEDVSSAAGITEVSLKQESKHEKTSFIIGNLDVATGINGTASQCGCDESDKDYTVRETENIEIHTDSIELTICGTMTTSSRDSAKDMQESGFSTEEFEKPLLMKKTISFLSDDSEKCSDEECLPICPKNSKDIAKSDDRKEEGMPPDITMKAAVSFKLSRPITTADDTQRESAKTTGSGALTGGFKAVQDDAGETQTADLELLIQETRYVSPTDSFTDVVHETHAIVSQSAPTIETRGRDLKKDDDKSENLNNTNYEEMIRSVSLESFSEEVYELTVVTEEIPDGERQNCTCSGDQDNRDHKGIQSDSVQKVTSETMTSAIDLLDLDETTRRFRELLTESRLVDQGMATEIVHSLSMATSMSEDHLKREGFASIIDSEQKVDDNNNITDSYLPEKIGKEEEVNKTPESEPLPCMCDEKEAMNASSSRENIDTDAVECNIEGTVAQEMTQNKGMQSDAIEESQVGTMTSDIKLDNSEERGIEDEESSKIMGSDGETEDAKQRECGCILETQMSAKSRNTRTCTVDFTEMFIQTEEIITQNYTTITDGVSQDLTIRSDVERGRKPEITEDDILDDDGVTFDTRRYSRTTADQSREARSPLRDQLIPSPDGSRSAGTNESLISFMRDLWSELEGNNNQPLKTYRHQVDSEESNNRPVSNHTTQSNSDISEEKADAHEDGTDISELGDVDESLFAVSSNDTELTAEISVTMTVVDEAGDNLQEQLNADDEMTDMLFMQMLDNDNILEGEAVDIVQRIVNLPGFDELLMDSSTMTDPHSIEDKSQTVDMCVQSDTILSVHSGGSISKASARSVPLVVDKKDVSYRRGPTTNNQQQEFADEKEKESIPEPAEEEKVKPVDGSENRKIPKNCLLNNCRESCSGFANQDLEYQSLDYTSKSDSELPSETDEDGDFKTQSTDEESTMPELHDVRNIDKSVENEKPVPTEIDGILNEPQSLIIKGNTVSGKVGTISVTDTVAIDNDDITVTRSTAVVNSTTQSVTGTVTVKTDNLTIKSSLTLTKPYSSDAISKKKSEPRTFKEIPDEAHSVPIESDEKNGACNETEAVPDQTGHVCTKKSVSEANEETNNAQDKISTRNTATSTKEISSLTETSPDRNEDMDRKSSPTLLGTTNNMEVQTDKISTKSAIMTTEELSNEDKTSLDQTEELICKVKDGMGTDDVTLNEIRNETEITQNQTDDLATKTTTTLTATETPCPNTTDAAPVHTDEIISKSKPELEVEETANITDNVLVQTDNISTRSNATMTANDPTDVMPAEIAELTSKSSTTLEIKEEQPVLSDLKGEGGLGDTEQVNERTSSRSIQTERVNANDSSTMTDQESKHDQKISQTGKDSTLIKENITDIKIETKTILAEKDGTIADSDKEQKLEILTTTTIKSSTVLPIMDENCHKCCGVKSSMSVQDCIKCCGHLGADKNILDKKSPESMVEMARQNSAVNQEQEDVKETAAKSDEIPASEASTGQRVGFKEMSDLLSSVSIQCDSIHTAHIGTSMSVPSKSAHDMLIKPSFQSDPTLMQHPSFAEHAEKKITTRSDHAVREVCSSTAEKSLSGLKVSIDNEHKISKKLITDTDYDLFESSKIPQDFGKDADTGSPIMSIVQINAPDHLIHLISVSVQNDPISTRNSSTMTELKLTELTDSHTDVKEAKSSKLDIPATLTPETEIPQNIEVEEGVRTDLDKQDVDTTEDKSDMKEKRTSISDKTMQTKSSNTMTTMMDTMPSHFSDRLVHYGTAVRTYVASSNHNDVGTRERHETSRNFAEEIQILLHEKTIKTVDMDSPDFIVRDYMTESSTKLTDGPEVTVSVEKMEDEVPELVEAPSPVHVEIAEAEGDFRPRDGENMDNDGIDFLMPEGDFLMPADGVPVISTTPTTPLVLSEPTVAQLQISEKQDGRFTMSDGPMELLYDVRLPDSHLDHPETPPRSRESEPTPPGTPSARLSSTDAAHLGPFIGKGYLTPDNLQVTGIGLSPDSSPPQTECECYSSMTEGDYMLHKIKKLVTPTASQFSQNNKDDLVSSAECIDCETCHSEILRKKKYRAPPPPEKPSEEAKEEEQTSPAEQETTPQEHEETTQPLQRKGSFRKSLFKKLKFEKSVKQKSSGKVSEEQPAPAPVPAPKPKVLTKPAAKPPPEMAPVKIKTEPSIHRKKCVPVADFPDKTFPKPDSRKSDQVQTKPKIVPKPPLRLPSTERTFRNRPRPCPPRPDDLPALEDRTDTRASCAAKVHDEILQQLGHKLQMIGQPRKREDLSPRRTIMIGRDISPIIGSVSIESERECLELRDMTSRLQTDGNEDGALLISLDNPPPGTEVVLQTAECPGKAHSLKIRSTQSGEDPRGTIGLIKTKTSHLPPRRVISPIRFQPRHYLMRPSSPTNVTPELRITPLQPYEHCGGRDGINPQTLTNLVLESPPVGTAYVVFPVPTDGTQPEEGAHRVLSDHVHHQADAVSVAIVDNNIVPYPHSTSCMCQDRCQTRVCLNQTQRMYAPAPEWIGTRQCTRNLCTRQGTRRWCSVHHTFHRD